MEEFKKYVSNTLYNLFKIENIDMQEEEILDILEIPKSEENGDITFPCFKLSKLLKNSPVNIASYLNNKLKEDENITKIEAVNGYLNFFVNKQSFVVDILKEILEKKEKYGSSNIGNSKTIVIDYSSPNIAKPFHLGHLRNTVLGKAIYNMYKTEGYNVVGINYLGDWGRQFGLIIEGYNRFKNEYDFNLKPLEAFSDIYVRINKLAKEDENVMNKGRENFKKLEEGNKEYVKIWEYIKEVSLKEYARIYDILGCTFDSYNGEAFYNDKMDEVIDMLEEKKVLVESNGAKVVFISENEPPCIILKSNGSTIYATRDLAAILYRSRTYDFGKAIYITACEQNLHFKQIFEVAKYLVDEKYYNNLVHVSYGMVRLKTGKMSSREGNVVYANDLINDAIYRAKQIISEKNTEMDDIDLVSKQIGVGALVFNNIKQSKVKDIIFDLDEILRFDGETGPYVQYTYVRCKSILDKANTILNSDDIHYELLNTKIEMKVIELLSDFENVIKKAVDLYEPAILARYLIDIATTFSTMYNELPILNQEEELKKARCALVYATSIVIKKGLNILGIEVPDKM